MTDLNKQYRNADNLRTRISIHQYSTNKTGFGRWIFSHYDIQPGSRILELGCGTGDMWKDQLDLLDGSSMLTLTDFSPGMLETAESTLGEHENIRYHVVDIQSIPFADNSYDIVIANMMLYHAPDLDRALSEVRRVLRPGGRFYCATYGEHGISEYVTELLREQNIKDNLNRSFTLQNGIFSLGKHFGEVQRLDYEDSLCIPCIEDFADYIFSMASLDGIQSLSHEELMKALEKRTVNGILHVPKEYGMFICH